MHTSIYDGMASYDPTTGISCSEGRHDGSQTLFRGLNEPSTAGTSSLYELASAPEEAPSSKRARIAGPEGSKDSRRFDLQPSSQNGLEAPNTVKDAGMDVDGYQEPFDFTKEWMSENAIDPTSFDSLELELARLSSPAYTIPFGLPYDAQSFPSDPKTPSLIGISFDSAELPPSSRSIYQRGGPPFVVAPAVGLETPDSASFVNFGLPSTSPVDQDWEKEFKMWAQGLGGGGMATPDSSSFGVDSTLPSSFVVGDGGSRKRDRSEMEREYQNSYEEVNEQYFEPEPITISTSNLLVEDFTPPPPPLPFRPYLKLVSPGKRKERQFRLGYDEDAVRMLREAQMTAMIQLATNVPITPSVFPLSDLLLPLLDSNNPNVKARTILYYNLIGRSPPASSPSSSPLGLQPAFVHNDDDEHKADPRALDLAWYKKEWLALGYTEDALRHFGWVEEE